VENAAGPRQLAPGTKLDNKYRIEQLIAVGGMGAVYLGTHTGLRKRVAIKVLNPQTSSTAMMERFHREAITASQIGHEGIAQVTDFGTSYEGEPFLVMEYLEGESLAARLHTGGRMRIDIACELGCAILAPLTAAHEAGIVHRDLKPDNVYLVRQSRGELVKLLDFGISRAPGLEGEFRLTKTGLVLGTPYYMSPEQARGESEVGAAADLYAFGVMLYEMLVGKVPIEGENYNQLMYRVLTAEYAPPRKERPEIPVELEQIILQAMAFDPKLRPGSAGEIERRLLAFCRPTFRDHQIERISSSSGLSLHALTAGVTAPMAAPIAGPVTGPITTPMATPVAEDSERLLASTAASESPDDTNRTPFVEPSEIAAPTPLPIAPRRRGLWITGAAVVLCGGIVGSLVIARDDEGAADPAPSGPIAPTTTPTPPTTAPTPPTPPTEAVTPAPPEIMLRFSIEPAAASASATIEIDGAPVAERQITVRKDNVLHRVTITAPGFVTREEEVRFDETQKLILQMRRAPTRPTRPAQPTEDARKPPRIEIKSPY
jgi:eukaryotic-like serine/threonine-protein kinase